MLGFAALLLLLQLLLLLLLLLGCCCFLVDFHVGSRHRSRLGPPPPRCGAKGPWRVPRHSAQRMITSKVTSVRGPERHDSASLRVTTAPYALLMTITPLKYFRRWGGGAPIVSSPWVSSCARRPSRRASSSRRSGSAPCPSLPSLPASSVPRSCFCGGPSRRRPSLELSLPPRRSTVGA